ncbi:unnamed protein product [Mycena citricolor]|uniref:DUF6533 domain-containing protein n=1 Tax=Mycena citricolor TaxID=2018698 RepID=A0AAD2K7K6_9AGAR|nr:unnamed protein product [Mycena citricolor]
MVLDPSLNSQLLFDLHKTAVAALAFYVWEYLITFDDEVRYIWTKPRKWVKFVFVFLRYFPFALILSNRILTDKVFNGATISYAALRAWYVAQVAVAHLAMTGVEIIMMTRVYALYRNNRWIGWGFVLLWIAETVVVLVGLFVTLPGLHFKPELMATSVPHSFAYLAISALVSQAIILGLTVYRYRAGEWAGTSLGTLLIRDGSMVYVAFAATTASACIYSLLSLNFGMTEYAWYLSCISISGCRLIINMQRLPNDRGSQSTILDTSELELTELAHNGDAYSTLRGEPELV